MENGTKSLLRAAICEFKKKVEPITKDKENPFFKSNYADMASILDVIDKPLAECGLTINSYTIYEGEDLVVRTDLRHKDSEEIITSVFPTFGGKAQEIGSSITYARRYNVQALLNLAAEDDDGNGANKADKIKKKTSAADNKKKYEEYSSCLDRVATKEQWVQVKPKKDEWVLWAQKNYGVEYADQLNDKFLALAKKFDLPAQTTAEKLNDDLPDFLK